MFIIYRDELGIVGETINEYGIDILDGIAHFNDKKIPVNNIESIKEENHE